jgi:GNAT superfamily N-acetyltransferase
MSDHTIRRATVDDIAALADLRLAFQRHFRPVPDEGALLSQVSDYLKRRMPTEDCVAWVAELDGTVVGSGVITVYERMLRDGVGREGYVQSMFTLPAHRGRGVASDMILRIMEYAKEQDVDLILMATADGRPIYERAGFAAADGYMRWR